MNTTTAAPCASLEAVAAALLGMAAATGNRAYARAAAALCAPAGGRPCLDDRSALLELAALLEHDSRLSISRAAMFVALTMDGRHSAESTARRLAKKFRRHLEI